LNESTLLEAETRETIDARLEAAGWEVQDYKKIEFDGGQLWHKWCRHS